MATLQLKVITPEEQVKDEQVEQVNVSTGDGEIGILPHHANLMAKVIPGELRIKKGGKIETFAVGEGFLQVTNNTLTILADLAQDVDQINEKEVEEAKKRAEQALKEKTLSNEEYAETLAVLEKSLAQLKVKRRHRVR